jgi:hypothetical protein
LLRYFPRNSVFQLSCALTLIGINQECPDLAFRSSKRVKSSVLGMVHCAYAHRRFYSKAIREDNLCSAYSCFINISKCKPEIFPCQLNSIAMSKAPSWPDRLQLKNKPVALVIHGHFNETEDTCLHNRT